MRKIQLIILVISWLLPSALKSQSLSDLNNCDLFQTMMKLYNESGIFPIRTDHFNVPQFKRDLLSTLDPDHLFFDSEVDLLLQKITESFMNEKPDAYCSIADSLVQRYKEDVKNTLFILEKFKSHPLDFNISDTLYTGDRDNELMTAKGLRCNRYIKAHILSDVIETTAKFDSLSNNPLILQAYIDSIQLIILNKEIIRIGNSLESETALEEKVYNACINSILIQYDPYCYSFSDNAFNDFKNHLSSTPRYFGFQLEMNPEGDIVIASVLPGSYTWRTSSVNAGDRVLKIEAGNNKSLLIDGVKLTEVHEFLETISTEQLTLTLLKPDRTVKEIELFKENLEHAEHAIQTFLLKGESNVGYIVLPAFYTSWDEGNSFGCAQDVGRAIYFLVKEYQIGSLIIDLRNNGGGSISEAIDLAGIFIDFGTLSISRNKNHEISSIKDFNRGTMYNGPLALLVNNYSASASEMLAAVLQDYRRALIVGDTTFGKATGQTLVPFGSENSNVLKITTNTYYRVTGSTYQNTGVIPDVILPEYNPPVLKTRKLTGDDFPEFVNRKTYYSPLPALPVQYLANNSRERVLNSERFKKIKEINQFFNTLNMDYLPLDFKDYYQLTRKREEISNEINIIHKFKTGLFEIELLARDQELKKTYKFYFDLFNRITESVSDDPYIEETYRILIDFKTFKTE